MVAACCLDRGRGGSVRTVSGRWAVGCGLWAGGYGLWAVAMGWGLWAVAMCCGLGLWAVGCGYVLWAGGYGPGLWAMDYGLWAMDDRQIGVGFPTAAKCFCPAKRLDRFWGPPCLLFNRLRGLFRGRAVTHLSPLLVPKVRISGTVPPSPIRLHGTHRTLNVALISRYPAQTRRSPVGMSDLSRDSNPVAVVRVVTRSFTEMNELWGMILIVCTHSMECFSEGDSCLGSQEIFLVGT
jgi:hypothetical protein